MRKENHWCRLINNDNISRQCLSNFNFNYLLYRNQSIAAKVKLKLANVWINFWLKNTYNFKWISLCDIVYLYGVLEVYIIKTTRKSIAAKWMRCFERQLWLVWQRQEFFRCVDSTYVLSLVNQQLPILQWHLPNWLEASYREANSSL